MSVSDHFKYYFFKTTDMSLITMRLNDAIMENNENVDSASQFLLKRMPIWHCQI